MYDSGVKNNEDEGTLISAIKKLSVQAQNKLVNVVTFLGLAQDRDETIGSFCARLRGQATVFNFETDCSSPTCTNKTSYMNEMVAHQLVRGLSDVEMQEQTMGHAATHSGLDFADYKVPRSQRNWEEIIRSYNCRSSGRSQQIIRLQKQRQGEHLTSHTQAQSGSSSTTAILHETQDYHLPR